MSIVTVKHKQITDRYTGSLLRHDIERALIKNGRAIVNMRTLEHLSPDAADACWGVLARRHGIDFISEHVLLPDISNETLITIAEAMQKAK